MGESNRVGDAQEQQGQKTRFLLAQVHRRVAIGAGVGGETLDFLLLLRGRLNHLNAVIPGSRPARSRVAVGGTATVTLVWVPR